MKARDNKCCEIRNVLKDLLICTDKKKKYYYLPAYFLIARCCYYVLPQAVVRKLFDTQNPSELLDEAMVLWMPGPKTFTGEDTVELHTHGSRYVLIDGLDFVLGLHIKQQTKKKLNNKIKIPAYYLLSYLLLLLEP